MDVHRHLRSSLADVSDRDATRRAQPERVADHRDRGERHRRRRDLRRELQPKERIEHAGGDRDAERVVDEGEEEVLLDVGDRRARQPRARRMPPRSPLSSVTPALSSATSVPVPIAMPTSARASAGASLMPSPAIATTRPAACSFSTTAAFSAGRTSATTSSMPDRAPDRLRRHPAVAGEHHRPQPFGAERRDHLGRARLDRIGQPQDAAPAARRRRRRRPSDRRRAARRRAPPAAPPSTPSSASSRAFPSATARPSTRPRTPRPAQRLDAVASPSATPRPAAPRTIAAASGCSLARSSDAASRSNVASSLRRRSRRPTTSSRLALGQRPGLVDHEGVDLVQDLQRLGVLEQHARRRAPCRSPP